MRRQQTMPLRSHVADFQLHVFGQFALNGQVVLRGILRAHMRLEIAEQNDRLECRPILTASTRRGDDSVKRIQISRNAPSLARKKAG